MGDVTVLFMLQNIIIFCIIFWGLTLLGGVFIKNKNKTTKKQFYECGFKSLSELNIQININFAIICVFLILYDVEFMFIFPALFNISLISIEQLIILSIFIFLIIISLFYDWQLNSLNWQY